MSNWLNKTKRAWEEIDYNKRRQYPLTEQECNFQSEPMFPHIAKAWDYYTEKTIVEHRTAYGFFKYLMELELGVELKNQKSQPR